MYIPDIIYENLPKFYILFGIVGVFTSVDFGKAFGFFLIGIAIYLYSKRKHYRAMVRKFKQYGG